MAPGQRTIFTNIGELATPVSDGDGPASGEGAGRVRRIPNARLVVEDGVIVEVGPGSPSVEGRSGSPAAESGSASGGFREDDPRGALGEAPNDRDGGAGEQVIDLGGRAVVPGFVDPHTHACFAGWREDEFQMRLQGRSYMEILQAGGGILRTTEQVRSAASEQLTDWTRGLLLRLLAKGSTTVEVKSGYGLSVADELKQLRAVREAAAGLPLDVVPTFMGAHAYPREYREDREAYVRLVRDEMLPAVSSEGLAEYCDVFCEEGVFSVPESRLILERARELGMALKLHADELAESGGSELAAELGAVSADHLLAPSRQGLEAMKSAGVIAVLLPGTAFFLNAPGYAPARTIIDMGIPVALATDFNPGSCTFDSMALIMSLAVLKMGLTPAEALVAATLNAAFAIGRGNNAGSLERGKQADFLVLEAPNFLHLTYQFGASLIHGVYKRGRLVGG